MPHNALSRGACVVRSGARDCLDRIACFSGEGNAGYANVAPQAKDTAIRRAPMLSFGHPKQSRVL